MFRSIGPWELLLILLIVLLIFGATRLPQVGEALGKAIRAFRRGFKSDVEEATGEAKADKTKPKKGSSQTKTGS